MTPTDIIDSDAPQIRTHVEQITSGLTDPVDRAVQLYLAVRDGIRYDPYAPFYLPEHYRASYVLAAGRGFCVSKASLLCAFARAGGIPARIGFATVVNHLATRQLIEYLGSSRFVYHGYVDLFLEGKWVICTPAFNRELCQRHHVPPLDFNGRENSQFQSFNRDNEQFMEYVEYHGVYADVPLDKILPAWEAEYGKERVRKWIQGHEAGRRGKVKNFYDEEPLHI
ncbi:MAG: transglutaminase domain-containing protein [Deltaproteobacteria bacterium]|nr:transglutaminase domain-containing protein [Deltaproteobacteria bacterium]